MYNKCIVKRCVCKCICGNIKDVASGGIRNGAITSCGCKTIRKHPIVYKKRSKIKYKSHYKRIISIHRNMKTRCYNKNNKDYKNYGGRGITVWDEWQSSINFYGWAISSGYEENLTLDRVDNTKGYSPYNCRWITMKEQENNRLNNRRIEYNGSIKTISEWSDLFNCSYNTIYHRLRTNSYSMYIVINKFYKS